MEADLTGLFVGVLICANVIGAQKVIHLTLLDLPVSFFLGQFFFPLSYALSIFQCELNSAQSARRMIWIGFASLFFTSCMAGLAVWIPPANKCVESVLGRTWRISAASLVAYLVGENANVRNIAMLCFCIHCQICYFCRVCN
jgi:uncharacterized PurR-regulated membrane protein YhhQ (DUF165 family)